MVDEKHAREEYSAVMSGKKSAGDIERWITVNGKHIPIRKGQRNSAAEKGYKGFRAKRELHGTKLKNAPDGTYDYDTGDPVSFKGEKKFQVSFQTTGTEDTGSDEYLTDEKYDDVVIQLSKETGSKPYLGKFETLETSFVCQSFEQAMSIAKKYNQMSIWSWEKMSEIINPDYDPAKNKVKRGK